MNNKRFVAALVIGFCLLSSNNTSAQYNDNENSFFSYKRFYAQLDVLDDASESKGVRGDIRAFMQNLADGIHIISAGDPEKAKAKLLKALQIWPDYFGTDFLLARVNEDTGNYKLSARFYKSYLDKLKSYSEGWYRLSGPLMKRITPYRIENYNDAYALVRDRLKTHGIDLALVQPFTPIPDFLKIIFVLIALGLAYVVIDYIIIPQIKRRWHINNPPEGSWVCKKCAAYNLNVRLECEKCGTKKTAQMKR